MFDISHRHLVLKNTLMRRAPVITAKAAEPRPVEPHATRLVTLLALSTTLMTGCATVQRPDPLEPVNRKVFAFNEGLDRVVLKPVATAYKAVLPSPVQTGVTNFFSNLGDPWSALNLMLQGRVKEGLSDVARFGTNTVAGCLGVLDLASGWGMSHHGEDFGKTLGAWGVGTGAFLMLPVLGPSDLRDAAALPIDSLGRPQTYVRNVPVRNSLTVLQAVNKRADLLQADKLLDEVSFDKYSFLRDAYLQRRRGGARKDDDAHETPAREVPAHDNGGESTKDSQEPF
jgi:phospholipid-binding lipoprotein MlaA